MAIGGFIHFTSFNYGTQNLGRNACVGNRSGCPCDRTTGTNSCGSQRARKPRAFSLLVLVTAALTAGCADRPTGKGRLSTPAVGRFIWETQTRSYTVVEFKEKKSPSGNVQYRYLRAVVPKPQSKAEVESATKEIYDELKEDIDSTRPDAELKRIRIIIYGDFVEALAFDGWRVLFAQTGQARDLPEWNGVDLTWRWRDPKSRPSSRQLAIFREYWDGLAVCEQTAYAPFRNEDGMLAVDCDLAEVEQLRRLEERNLVESLAQKYEMELAELANDIALVQQWRFGDAFIAEADAKQPVIAGFGQYQTVSHATGQGESYADTVVRTGGSAGAADGRSDTVQTASW